MDTLAENPFTLIIASDPQLWWWRGSPDDAGHEPDCNDDCKKQKALDANSLFVNAMNHITELGKWQTTNSLTQNSGSVLAPRAVVLNGDLTATGRDDELDYFKSYYNDQLSLPVVPSLGNHDYKLYVNDCGKPFDTNTLPDYIAEILRINKVDHPGDSNYCAKQLVRYMREMLRDGAVKNFAGNLVARFDLDSLAYSFSINNYHFIHLNEYPSYEADLTTYVPDWLAVIIKGATDTLNQFPGVDLPTWDHPTWEDLLGEENIRVRSAIPWLFSELQIASAEGKKIVLFIHDCGSEWTPSNDDAFMQTIQGHNLVAIFAGHLHPHHGYWGYLDTVKSEFHGAQFNNYPSDYDRLEYPGVDDGYNPPGQYIPLFRSGSVDYRTFLLAEFAETYFNVGVIDTRTGTPHFLTESTIADRDPVFSNFDAGHEPMLLRTYPLRHYFRVEWYDAADIVYGMPLTEAQLNASAQVPATAQYEPPLGTILPAGAHELRVTFTPDDARYQPATAQVHLFVEKATPVLEWKNPADIMYGTALSAAQLNASASVPGTFEYSPSLGTILQAGAQQTLRVDFTPQDRANYNSLHTNVLLNVTRAAPTMVWAAPGDIDYGTPLNASQLNAQAHWTLNGNAVSVDGAFSYTPPFGAVLDVGSGQTLRVAFTPNDTVNYNAMEATTTLDVLHGHPVIEAVTFSPATFPVNSRVEVSITVRNDSIQPHETMGPESGFEYTEGDNFETRGFLPADGAFRVGVDLVNSPYPLTYPYRWGLSKNLAPYETVVVTGYIRFHNRRLDGQYFAGLLHEPGMVLQDNQGLTSIHVERP